MDKTQVLMIHDGGLDDYLSVMLLLTMDHVDVLGIAVTPADCYIEPAVSATRKLLSLMGRADVTVGQSTVRGLNPFPRALRRTSFQVDNLPILNAQSADDTPLARESGQAMVARILAGSESPIVVLETGPLTTLAEAIKLDTSAARKIAKVVWMGGALHVPGNVGPHLDANIDGTAEFNAYWDPIAAHEVWATDIPLTICPLDITNTVPLTQEFMDRLAENRSYELSDLAGQLYALVRHQPYYFWDVLTTSFLAQPDLFQTTEERVSLVAEGPSQGRTMPDPNGRTVTVLQKVEVAGFYDYILGRWAR